MLGDRNDIDVAEVLLFDRFGKFASKHRDFVVVPQEEKLSERPFFYYARDGLLDAVRLGKWKLHLGKQQWRGKKDKGPFPVSLYNLEDDISEKKNLAEEYPKVVKKLKDLMLEFDKTLN